MAAITAARHWARAATAVFALGLVAQCWLWNRSSYHWDQIDLYRMGMDLALDGRLLPFGKTMSGGGAIVGSLLELVIGIPLAVWFHFRSPALVVILFQAAAGLLLWRLFGRALGARFAAFYLIVYWLGPWRLYHSGFIWEPSYLLLPAALHLHACWSQREEGRFAASVLLGLTVVAAPQLHPSGIVLAGLTALLLWRRAVRVRLGGLALGALAAALTLIPTFLAVARGGATPAGLWSWPGLGFWRVFPPFKALGYWFRLGSLDIGRRLRQVSFYPGDETAGAGHLVELVIRAVEVLAAVTVLVAVVASIRYFFPGRGGASAEPGRRFLRIYVAGSLLTLIVAAGLTAQTIQGWHTMIVLHAAAVPVAAWLERVGRGRGPAGSRVVFGLLALGALAVSAILGLGHPMYTPPPEPLPLLEIRPDHIVDPALRPAPMPD